MTAWKGCLASLFFTAAVLSAQQQPKFDGTWQMDTAKSHIADGRILTVTIATVNTGIKITVKTERTPVRNSPLKSTVNSTAKPAKDPNRVTRPGSLFGTTDPP